MITRTEIADFISKKLESKIDELTSQYQHSKPKIGHFYIDDLLPEDVARKFFTCFPNQSDMKLKKSIREYKFIAAQMDQYNPILEEAIFAFQDARVVDLISKICHIESLYPDEHLYAGGISLMGIIIS